MALLDVLTRQRKSDLLKTPPPTVGEPSALAQDAEVSSSPTFGLAKAPIGGDPLETLEQELQGGAPKEDPLGALEQELSTPTGADPLAKLETELGGAPKVPPTPEEPGIVASFANVLKDAGKVRSREDALSFALNHPTATAALIDTLTFMPALKLTRLGVAGLAPLVGKVQQGLAAGAATGIGMGELFRAVERAISGKGPLSPTEQILTNLIEAGIGAFIGKGEASRELRSLVKREVGQPSMEEVLGAQRTAGRVVPSREAFETMQAAEGVQEILTPIGEQHIRETAGELGRQATEKEAAISALQSQVGTSELLAEAAGTQRITPAMPGVARPEMPQITESGVPVMRARLRPSERAVSPEGEISPVVKAVDEATPDVPMYAQAPKPTAANGSLQAMVEKETIGKLDAQLGAALEEAFRVNNIPRNTHMPLVEQLYVLTDPKYIGALPEAAQRAGFPDVRSLFDALRGEARKSAQLMQTLSTISQNLTQEAGDAELLAAASRALHNELQTDLIHKATGVYKKLHLVRLETASRNAMSQAVKSVADAWDVATETVIRKVYRKAGLDVDIPPHETVFQALDPLARLFMRNKGIADKILELYPKVKDKLFLQYMSDVTRGGGTINAAADGLNVLNRLQEMFYKRAGFVGRLQAWLQARGKDLRTIPPEAIPEEGITEATQYAQSTTFAGEPASELGKAFVRGMGAAEPVSTLVVLFPRFWAIAAEWAATHFPLTGAANTFYKASKTGFASPEATKALAKTINGTILTFAAYKAAEAGHLVRDPQQGIMVVGPGGRRLPLRNFAPLISPLLGGWLLYHYRQGTADISGEAITNLVEESIGDRPRTKETTNEIMGIIQALSGEEGPPMERAKTEVAARITAPLTIPLEQLNDALAAWEQFTAEKGEEPVHRVVRQPVGTFGQAKRNIPGLATELPPKFPTLSVGPETKGVGAMFGLTPKSPANPVEREVERLGFRMEEILPTQGDPEANNLVRKHLGPLVEEFVTPLLESSRYQKGSTTQQRVLLKEWLATARHRAIREAQAENPKLFGKLVFHRRGRMEEAELKEALGKPGEDIPLEAFLPRGRRRR